MSDMSLVLLSASTLPGDSKPLSDGEMLLLAQIGGVLGRSSFRDTWIRESLTP